MRGKTVVITGGTSGIGEVAAEILAKKAARIVLVARDQTRGDATLARLRNSAPGVAHSIYFADLTRLAEMKRVAAQIADQEPRIDVLINNAGALFARRRLTQDGLEFTFALNHMAYFVLTGGLRKRLLASRPARIINTASAAHQGAILDFDDLQSAKNFGAMKAYSRSKRCNILFTRELARRLHGTGVTANCLHPGFVATISIRYSYRLRRFSLINAISIIRRIASDRDGWSGCCFAHSSTRAVSAGGIRKAVTGSCPVAGRPPRRFCFTFCLTVIWVCVIHFGRPMARVATSPPALTQAAEMSHGPG
jgi:NAD(P)-dependent dehydrogenase (short-subunit alcohol dehydrogenase family)